MKKTDFVCTVGEGKELVLSAGEDHSQGIFRGMDVRVLQWGVFRGKNRIRFFYGAESVTEEPGIKRPVFKPGVSLSYFFHVVKNIDIFSLPHWDTVNVVNMRGMFDSAAAFNQFIGYWDTRNVTDMGFMFRSAAAFNQYIGSWDTGDVTDMNGMFFGASAFNQDLSSWDTRSVAEMRYMFYKARAFNQNLSGWKTRQVKDMIFMFESANMMQEKNKPKGAE